MLLLGIIDFAVATDGRVEVFVCITKVGRIM